MYLSHFNIQEKPFTLSTDPRFLWIGSNQKQALTTLTYGLQENKGLVVIGGEFGTGKTTLVNAFVKGLDDKVVVAHLPEPGTDLQDTLQTVAEGLGIRKKYKTREGLTRALIDVAHDPQGQKRRLLLIIDEAQILTPELQEEVLRLACLEYKQSRLLHILLIGQNEVYNWLAKSTREAFIKQVSATCKLHPLSESETAAYINHRLHIAGADQIPFTDGAIRAIHNFSHGVPRTINLVCDFSLLHTQLNDAEKVDSEAVDACKERFQIASLVDTGPSEVALRAITPLTAKAATTYRPNAWRVRQIPVFVLLLLLIVGGYFFYDGKRLDQLIPQDHFLTRFFAPASPQPLQQEVQSASVPEPAESETRQQTATLLPVGQTSKTKPPSPLKMFPSLKETIKNTPSDLLPTVSAESVGRGGSQEGQPALPKDAIAPTVAVETHNAAAPPPSPADVDDERGRLTADAEESTATDPGDIIDWLIQEKNKSETPTSSPSSEINP